MKKFIWAFRHAKENNLKLIWWNGTGQYYTLMSPWEWHGEEILINFWTLNKEKGGGNGNTGTI